MSKYLLFLFLIVFSTGKAQEDKMTISEVEILKKEVHKRAQELKTITSTFIQLKHIDFLSNDIKSSGDLYFKSPNIIKWSYTKPYEYSVIFKNKSLYINDAGKKSDINLTSNKIFRNLNDLIVKSVSGNMLDDPQFLTEFYKLDGFYVATMKPIDKTLSTLFTEIILNFNIQTFLVEKVLLVESSGDYTLIKFDNIDINNTIPDAIFAH
ncbi:outer membrane lipoprotein carrier protein LolA [Aquimarina addita]|uniref:Outer membrane lipoprotein carrier protein LolA n=1 Tax=Aquimarina addita TaxID=870485 RepID=A0ABP6UIB4_9FLAO